MATDDGEFDSLQWEKPRACDDFPGMTRTGTPVTASETTAIKAAHDGKDLYVRFTMSDQAIAERVTHAAAAEEERWPKGDHLEFWLFAGLDRYVFALNAAGAQYDAKNLDRRWESGWQLKVRRTDREWEAVAVIPLAVLGLTPGEDTRIRWFCTREINRKNNDPEHISFQGHPLYYRSFPIVVQ
jgi:hypothetical protein